MEPTAVVENKAANDIPAETPQESSLEAAVQESQEAIATAEPVKKRGRKKAPRDENGNIIRAEKPVESKSATKGEVTPPALPPSYLKPVLNFPFKAAALKTQFPQWELSEKEQEENAILLDAVIRRYLPQMQSEHPELLALSIGIGMACVSRYLAYRAFLESREAQNAISRSEGREAVSEKKNKKEKPVEVVSPSNDLGGFLNGEASRSPQI